MKKIKAYTLIEMLIVMSIMVIVLSIGITSYTAYIETTKYNQDVANLESDITAMQRASMLFKKDADDGWVYGVGIDFGGIIEGNGTYKFFKWCSGFEDYGDIRTTSKYPNYNPDTDSSWGLPITNPDPEPYQSTSCADFIDPATNPNGAIVSLSGYGIGRLNLGEDVFAVNMGTGDYNGAQYLLFESVTGRAFIFDSAGNLVNDNLGIVFEKRVGTSNIMSIYNLTGRTEIFGINIVDRVPEDDPTDGDPTDGDPTSEAEGFEPITIISDDKDVRYITPILYTE
jgi:prepilin-type N-terminal cleavage/methylation domain-containing protein